MRCVFKGHANVYDLQTVTQIFFPNEPFTQESEPSPTGVSVVTILGDTCEAQVYEDNIKKASHAFKIPPDGDLHETRRLLMVAMFLALREFTGQNPPWGALAGIRPAKMARLLMDKGMGREEIVKSLVEGYYAKPEKISLAADVALASLKMIGQQSEDGFSLYVGIPFCPSRCLYCSFASYPIGIGKDTDPYLRALLRELKAIARISQGKTLDSVYIGGGTPAALDRGKLLVLLEMVDAYFDVRNAKEYSVEAGRPDALDLDKLRLMKEHGATRISINPQTLSDETLALIGRNHTTSDFLKAFRLAREAGFKNINSDLILGLPGEDPEQVERTFEGMAELEPESLTVHTLAVKRASLLKESLESHQSSIAKAAQMEKMLAASQTACAKMGMKPYYMYRQKNMVGNFENVGYCLPGLESFYNVAIMEETQTIWAAGAGAVSKIVCGENRFVRVANVKSLSDYISRIDEMIARKEEKLNGASNPQGDEGHLRGSGDPLAEA
ncbi:MAG: coproporphyrinogen dehydrogenase HemZ [Clostridiales bacterium]|jgi:oxygen-independent coproporphyrinogen-3 oxidase|nr:coproporphyrinogen dehydrogenase HemZ [Clostridiales bacterium]